ncbi:MAG: hypothetical protein LBT34_00380, partial [Clostridiales Family XIII bacterium]|nr:hypothetical protein [Clostridiales Family XIII bacterium]
MKLEVIYSDRRRSACGRGECADRTGAKKMDKQKVLVGSPICQKPEILEMFLASLKNLVSHSISIDF